MVFSTYDEAYNYIKSHGGTLISPRYGLYIVVN